MKQMPGHSMQDICQAVGISRNTYYKYVRPSQKGHAGTEGEDLLD